MMKWKALPVIACILFCASGAFAQNMLLNPGFEDEANNGAVGADGALLPQYWADNNPSGWHKAGNWGNKARENWRAHSGSWEAAIPAKWGAFTDDFGGYWQHSTNAVVVGEPYRATLWVWADSDYSAWENRFKLEFFNSSGGMISAATNIFASPGTDWQQISVQGVAPVGCAEVGVSIETAGMGSSGALQLDDIELYRVLQAPSITITDPAGSTQVVQNAVAQYTLKGTAQKAKGMMAWTNAATGVIGTFTASSNWTVSGVDLAEGANLITVTATNADGMGSASATIYRHAPTPSVYVISPLSGTEVGTLVDSHMVYGSCNSNTLSIRWDNGRGSTGTGTIYNGSTWTATVALAHGDNPIVVTGTNRTGLAVTGTVLIVRQSDPPEIEITYPTSTLTVAYSVSSVSVSGGCYNAAIGNVTWTNGLTGASGAVPVSFAWRATNIALNVGANVLTFSCSNVPGEVASATVTVIREDILPQIIITSPSSDINVANTMQTYKVMGTVNTSVVGFITMTNAATGNVLQKSVPTGGGWSFTGITLREGANPITVYGSNITGQVAYDSVIIYRDYVKANLWINEMHYVNAGYPDYNEGIEIAGPAGSVLDQYTLYLYGENGCVYNSNRLSGAIDNETNGYGAVWFAYDDGSGDTILNGPNCGMALAYKGELMEFISYRGTVTAADGPAAGQTSSDIGVTEKVDTPMWYSLQLQGFGTSRTSFAWSEPITNSYGRLNPAQLLSGDRDGNGIPDVWQDIYFPISSNVAAQADADGDGVPNIGEFRADTNPTDSHAYPEIAELHFVSGYPVLYFASSAQRSYIVQRRANLMTGSWTNIGEAFMGTGGTKVFVVPSLLTNGFLRYKVWMPGE